MALRDLTRKIADFLSKNPNTRVLSDLEDDRLGGDIVESYGEQLDRFDERVQPFLDSGDYSAASWEIYDITSYLRLRIRDIGGQCIHSGWHYITAAEDLAKSMKEGSAPPQHLLDEVKAYSAQVRMRVNRERRLNQ